MFYRPQFCCHCGEKIIRAKWTPLTSRRFCDFCEIEQKQHDLLPRAVLVLSLFFGAAGISAYISRSGDPGAVNSPRVAQSRELRTSAEKLNSRSNSAAVAGSTPPAATPTSPAPADPISNNKQREIESNSSTEAVYYCGALTKKGTPCTRRVKTKGRCWQHTGQPAVAATRP